MARAGSAPAAPSVRDPLRFPRARRRTRGASDSVAAGTGSRCPAQSMASCVHQPAASAPFPSATSPWPRLARPITSSRCNSRLNAT
eukprot:3945285-Pyramimonas_sp.AAC.1